MARRVLRIEADAVTALSQRLDASFTRATELILQCHGRIIVSGIGKSGHVARKIAATMASTGTPAYFLHAAEAVHGDLGMLTRDDLLIAISNSGESDELLTVIPLVKRQGGRLIAITGNPDSALAREADVHLDAGVAEEACPSISPLLPAPRQPSPSATRLRWRCSMRAALGPRILRALIRPVHWDASCSPTCAM